MAGADDRGGDDDQQHQQHQQPYQQQHQQRQSLRALYARVKSSPLEVVAIDTAGVAPLPSPPPSSDESAGSAPPSPPSGGGGGGYERVPLRTRASVLDRELRAVLSAPPTLEGVHGALERAVLNLRATEAFDDAWAEIDAEPQVSSSIWGGGELRRSEIEGRGKKKSRAERRGGAGDTQGAGESVLFPPPPLLTHSLTRAPKPIHLTTKTPNQTT
jgi:hypothetical protein